MRRKEALDGHTREAILQRLREARDPKGRDSRESRAARLRTTEARQEILVRRDYSPFSPKRTIRSAMRQL